MEENKKNAPLWTAEEAKAATGGEITHDFQANGVSIDTRSLKPGDIFLALKGDRLDGHDYVAAAFQAGAAAAIVSKDYVPADPAWPLVRVDDTMQALQALGEAARARTQATIIAVTGSAGKTGTKEMLATMFAALGKTHASKKSFNNHWGVPLSLANLPRDAAFGIFELGMNHAGELAVLTAQVRPHVALVTTIEPAHIEHFGTLEAIADAKAEIFLAMDENGIVVLNMDNPMYTRLRAAAEKQGVGTILGFGEDDHASSRLVDCALHADCSKVTGDVMGERVKYRLPIPGQHIAMNALGALTVLKSVGGDLTPAIKALENAVPVAGRGNRLQITIVEGQPPVTIIDESYNANPGSMLAAFAVFEMTEPAAGGRRIAVLGDMLELGKEGPRLHSDLANPLLKARADLVFCCGAQMDALFQALPADWQGGQAQDSKALAEKVIDAVRPGDVILVKGSAGSKMAYIVEALRALQVSPSSKIKDNRNAL